MKQLITGIMILVSLAFIWSCKPNRTFSENEIALIPQVQKMTLENRRLNSRKVLNLLLKVLIRK